MQKTIELKEQLKALEKKLFLIYAFGLLALISLSILSNFILNEQAAEQAVSLIKRTVSHGDYRETIYTLNDAKLDHFEAVIYYKEDSTRMFSLPAQLDPAFAADSGFGFNLLHSKLKIDLFFGEDGQHKMGSVVFIFGRLSHVPYAFMIWLFFLLGTFPVIRSSRHQVIKNYQKELTLRDETTRADLARRVRHDIRSPYGALQIAIRDLTGLNPKQQAIIQRATDRVGEIIAELELIRPASDAQESQLGLIESKSLLALTQEIIQEKKTQFQIQPGISIATRFSKNSFLQFAKINGSDFKRSLSNIIDNSADSFRDGRGNIVVGLDSSENQIHVSVADDGCGISAEILPHVADKGFTNKSRGSGLGLYYAEKTTTDCGGLLSIESAAGRGTTVKISIPSAPPPSWYVSSIEIPKNGTVVVLDDQDSTHLSWKMRLDALKEQGGTFFVIQFKAPDEFLCWHQKHPPSHETLYLFDYDLGSEKATGLDLIEQLGLASNALLVTGHFDSPEIQRRCSKNNVGLVAKSYLSEIQIKLSDVC